MQKDRNCRNIEKVASGIFAHANIACCFSMFLLADKGKRSLQIRDVTFRISLFQEPLPSPFSNKKRSRVQSGIFAHANIPL